MGMELEPIRDLGTCKARVLTARLLCQIQHNSTQILTVILALVMTIPLTLFRRGAKTQEITQALTATPKLIFILTINLLPALTLNLVPTIA